MDVPRRAPVVVRRLPNLEAPMPPTNGYYESSEYDWGSNELNIYTDGSSKNNGRYNSTAGYGVFIPSNKHLRECIVSNRTPRGAYGKATNNTSELMAIISALEYIKFTAVPKDVSWMINYDSNYAAGVITGSMTARKNKDLVGTGRLLLSQCRAMGSEVGFRHIKAHTSESGMFAIGNRIADSLATRASSLP